MGTTGLMPEVARYAVMLAHSLSSNELCEKPTMLLVRVRMENMQRRDVIMLDSDVLTGTVARGNICIVTSGDIAMYK